MRWQDRLRAVLGSTLVQPCSEEHPCPGPEPDQRHIDAFGSCMFRGEHGVTLGVKPHVEAIVAQVAFDRAEFIAMLVGETGEACAGCGVLLVAERVAAYQPDSGDVLCGNCTAAWRASAEGWAWDDASSLDAAAQRDAERRR